MIKLTRLNQQVIAINPDHITSVDASPDTTICMMDGDKIIVRESLDELIERVVCFRRRIRTLERSDDGLETFEGDPPRVPPLRRRDSLSPYRSEPAGRSRGER